MLTSQVKNNLFAGREWKESDLKYNCSNTAHKTFKVVIWDPDLKEYFAANMPWWQWALIKLAMPQIAPKIKTAPPKAPLSRTLILSSSRPLKRLSSWNKEMPAGDSSAIGRPAPPLAYIFSKVDGALAQGIFLLD